MTNALHFVNFRGDEYTRAIRVFGRPDFVHHEYDRRAIAEIMPGDTVVFARGDDAQPVFQYTYDDSAHF